MKMRGSFFKKICDYTRGGHNQADAGHNRSDGGHKGILAGHNEPHGGHKPYTTKKRKKKRAQGPLSIVILLTAKAEFSNKITVTLNFIVS